MDLEELRAFLAVAEAGSFLAAATSLRMPRATLRRRIDQLEARAGVLLVDRTRDGVSLTEAGKLLAARGRLMVQESNALLQSVREAGSEPAGVLRVLLPVGLPPHVLIHVLGIARKHPRLAFRLHFSDDPIAGLMESVDLAFHFGETSPAGPWVSRELMRTRVWLVASREYLARRGTPRSVEELSRHDLLAWESPGDDGRSWPLLRGGTFPVSPLVTAQDIHVIRQFALAGHGIALLPDPGIPDEGLPEGTIVPVLPDIVGRELGFRVVVPAVLSEIPRIKAMLDLLEPFLGKLGL
ncbi:LysR family transcriptional regulator [Polyangium mundeleinium]|uniref:LysR family transcriptional regulator n=1 Tax=Polyangium mundeleinium TaxID=2995306 RepID=A0ABT5ET48_9BACT|nr:LysR family transcriptional regulator [Polyangium mundeleinium]MDC0743906.1 LysR family transcriptional regulator [Polyangium mundeleinium]